MKPNGGHVRLAQIDAALARLDDGEYGYCVTCGEEINADGWRSTPPLPCVCAMPNNAWGACKGLCDK